MPTAPPPICQSLILCDLVHQDPGTRKHFLLGTFSAITAREFPTTHPRMGIFCELTNGHGKTGVSIKIARVTADQVEGELLGSIDTDMEFTDPRMTIVFGGNLGNVTFPEPGEYRVYVEANGRLLNERKLVLRRLE